MKKIFRTFTFYFMLLSLAIIYTHYIGRDSHGIVLFHLNIILKSLLYNDIVRGVVMSGPKIKCGSLSGEIYIYWYVAHFITFVIYGMFFDFIKFFIAGNHSLSARGQDS